MLSKKQKIIVVGTMVLVSIMLVVSIVSGYYPQKINTPFTLTVISDNATQCNLTDIQTNNYVTIYNKPMTKDGTTFYYTLNANNYSSLGNVCHDIKCTDGNNVDVGSICREVTTTGFLGTLGFYILFIIIIVLIFIVGLYTKNEWIMSLGSILVLFLGFFVINNGIDMIKDTKTTYPIGLIIWALGLYFLYLSVEDHLRWWN